MKRAPLPSNMQFDDCDGCRLVFSRRARPFVMTMQGPEGSLTIGICAGCALTLSGNDRATAEQVSARVEATARLRPNRTEAPR
ncbi:hypothetical protein [Frateuria terrea]|uniref:Uncharacterized protein n=1 Tax=Frateuria terrea TaxID=529704 RepID=A0A1H6UK68_9GAMM|nr:hypothetical protein [Frateuria terrea]SEI92698.1 hypothetical protein SAMN04487997_2063 [Frateuria terrea]SFP35165.1 hypothetical protein SAMN02927913_1664 [Frateuria terrea]